MTYVLIHRHGPGECRHAHSAFKAVDARLPDTTPHACADGGHTIWWKVRAESPRHALDLLPEVLRRSANPVPIG